MHEKSHFIIGLMKLYAPILRRLDGETYYLLFNLRISSSPVVSH